MDQAHTKIDEIRRFCLRMAELAGEEQEPETEVVPPSDRMRGAFDPSVIRGIRLAERGWSLYDPQNLPQGKRTLQLLRREMYEWLQSLGQARIMFLSGPPGAGKTYLAHLLAYNTLRVKDRWTARCDRDYDLRVELREDRRSRTDTWPLLREMEESVRPEVQVFEEFGHQIRGGYDVEDWHYVHLRLFDRWCRQPRLVIYVTNLPLEGRNSLETSEKGVRGSAPMTSRLLSAGVRRLTLAGKDFRV